MLKRLLITGAAGALGTHCRQNLGHIAEKIRVSDIADLGDAAAHEEVVNADLSDRDAVLSLVDGCDGILHFGGKATEGEWNVVRDANIEGMYNLYEAARQSGCRRIFYASSIHAVGYHPVTGSLDEAICIRPDTLYGVSKAFGEALARFYFEKFGIETACVRIASCVPQPVNHRMLATWLSYDDLVRLVERVFTVPVLGCPILFGVSANDRRWADNRSAGFLGWNPQDNAETHFARLMEEQGDPDPASSDFHHIGGPYVDLPLSDDQDGSSS